MAVELNLINKSNPRRYFSSTANSSSVGIDTSSMVLLLDSIGSILLFNVATFLAWEISSELYFKETEQNKNYLIQAIIDDSGNPRIDIDTLFAMRVEYPNLLFDAMNPIAVLVPSNRLDTLAYLSSSEISAIKHIQVQISEDSIDQDIEILEKLDINESKDMKKISFIPEANSDVELTPSQIVKLKQIGDFGSKISDGGGSFQLTIQPYSKLSADEFSAVTSLTDEIKIITPSLFTIEVTSSIHESLQQLRKIPLMRKNSIELIVATEVTPFVSEFDLLYLRFHENVKISFSSEENELILKLPNLRVLKSNIASIDKLFTLSKQGINKIFVDNVSEDSFVDISVPNFAILDRLNFQVQNVPLHIQINNNDDLRRLDFSSSSSSLNANFISFDNFLSLDISSMYKMVYKGFSLYDERASKAGVLFLNKDEVKLIESNPPEWIHLLAKSGIHTFNFLDPQILSEDFTEALISQNLSVLNTPVDGDLLVSGIVFNEDSLVSGVVDGDFMSSDNALQIASLLNDINIDRLFIKIDSDSDLVLDVSLDEFSNWAVNAHLDFGGATAKIPEDWVNANLNENSSIEFFENNLNISVVGVSSDNLLHLQIA